jgi:ORF6N domain
MLATLPNTRVPLSRIEHAIHVLRGQRVILDADLGALYEVAVKRLNEQVSRNRDRFPDDFMFQLTRSETVSLRSQTATLEAGSRGQHRKYRPYAFTEQGVAMLSSVLRSPRAVQVNIEIVRAFVRLRQMLQANVELAKKLKALESKYDSQFRVVFEAIRELMTPPEKPKPRIGFGTDVTRHESSKVAD